MSYVIQILGNPALGRTPFDEEYVLEYDPGRDGKDPLGNPMLCHLRTTPLPEKAMRFEDFADAHALWVQVDPRNPVRPDGKPNRPLTAFTITLERVRG